MNARPTVQGQHKSPEPRFDAKFIETHRILDRYLEGQLPPKGARDLENWCRANPDYLNSLKLAERTQAGLRLLESTSRPLDLSEPGAPWWKSPYVSLALALLAAGCLIVIWAMHSKNSLLRSELADAVRTVHQGTLIQPSTETALHVAPDRTAGSEHARITLNHATPELVDLHIDMSYSKSTLFRLIVDKEDQGRALIVGGLTKDSNNELRVTFNSSGLSAGKYPIRIEAAPRGNLAPQVEGWILLEVH